MVQYSARRHVHVRRKARFKGNSYRHRSPITQAFLQFVRSCPTSHLKAGKCATRVSAVKMDQGNGRLLQFDEIEPFKRSCREILQCPPQEEALSIIVIERVAEMGPISKLLHKRVSLAVFSHVHEDPIFIPLRVSSVEECR